MTTPGASASSVTDGNGSVFGGKQAASANLAFLALPSGTPLAGEVPTATGSGAASAWTAQPGIGRGFRPQGITYQDLLFTGQSGGFTPVIAGTGSSGGTDTSDFVLGTQAVKVTTNGAGANTNIHGTFTSALNLTGKIPVLWLKLENLAHFSNTYPRFFLGDTNLTTCYSWKLGDSPTTPWLLDGEWLRITLPFGTAATIGSPSRASLPSFTIQIFDDNTANPVTVHLGGLATMREPPRWPNGVVSITFDDGYLGQFQTARPYMDKYGFRATAYLITETLWNHGSGLFNSYMTLAQAQQLEQMSGWEIGSHAFTAANHNAGYVSIGDTAALADMQLAKAYLRDQGFRSPEQFAYPLGAYGTGTTANARRLFGSSRSISQIGGFPDETFPPADLSRLRSQAVSSLNGPPLATVKTYVDQAFANKEWLVLTFHDIQAVASGDKQWDTADFQSLIDYIATKTIPVRTVSEVLRSDPDVAPS